MTQRNDDLVPERRNGHRLALFRRSKRIREQIGPDFFLIGEVWGGDAQVDAQFVRVLVAQLRQKIEAEPSSPRIILTVPGVGYRLRRDDD